MKRWIWQQSEWPHFDWDESSLISALMKTSYWQGSLSGIAEHFTQTQRQEALAEVLIQDVIKTSAIEGEILQAASVRSSVMQRLGIKNLVTAPGMLHEGILDITEEL
jgi:Fic family protein